MQRHHRRGAIEGAARWAALTLTLTLACSGDPGEDASATATMTSEGTTTTDASASAGGTSVGTTTAGTTSTSTSTTSTSTTSSESESDTEAPPVICMVTPMEHLEACPGEPCPIVADVELRCDDDEVAAPGIRVAATADDTWLVTASSNQRVLLRVGEDRGDGGEVVDVLPPAFDRETILLAADPFGELHAMADLTQPPTYVDGLTHVGSADGWAPSLVFDAPKYVPVLDLEVDLGGTPHLWFIGDAPDQLNLATRQGKGPWQIELAPVPAGVDWTHYTLTSAGARVSAGFREEGPGWQLKTLIAGDEAALGDPVVDLFPWVYRLTPAPIPEAPAGPPFAAAIQHLDGVRVAWPEGQGYTEVLIPGTELLAVTCDGTWNEGCPGPCHEVGEGLEEGALALARAGDDAWLVVLRTRLDLMVTYKEQCDREIGCWCSGQVESDASYGVLSVVRVPFAGAPAEALAQPIASIALWDLFSGWDDTPRGIDARAFGEHLAVAVRTEDAIGGPHAVRVLRIDTSLLPP